MSSSIQRSFLTFVILLALPLALSAQGWIEPRPGVPPMQWGVQKLRTTVSVRVTDRIAQVEVEEWFRNNGGGLGEGDYVYPLPGEAVFSSYSLYQGEQELRGELMDATRARDIYEAIVRARRDPALIELVGKGMMRARVFPIEPGQTRRITLRYTQVLDRSGDGLQFRYAAGGRNTGAATPTPQREPTPLSFTLVVENGARFRDAFSPTHDVRVERQDGRMTVRPRGDLHGDVALFLPFSENAVGVTVATHRPVGEAGYFMMTLSPGAVAASRVPRDVTVVVDVSGSMSGDKIEQARRALLQLLGTLGAQDRIRLIAFSNVVRPWREGWTSASAAELREARRWVNDLRAEGGTNINDALERAFAETSPAMRLPIVIFMTDGLPTNGETRPERIAAMAEARRGRARVFAFGVGYDVNTNLLDRLSAAARGTTQYVRPDEDVEQAVGALATKLRYPVLTDLSVVARGADISEIYPRDLPDLFAGEELVVFGRYSGAAQTTIGVTGRRDGREERYGTAVMFPSRAEGDDYIPRLWAARKIGDLDRRIRSAQADGASRTQLTALIDELRETAMRYGLLSEYTAYLVQEPNVVANQSAAVGNARVATAAAPAAPPPPAVSGQGAVARAEESRRAREATSLADLSLAQKAVAGRLSGVGTGDASSANVRMIAGRTFTLRDSVWQDARHAQQRVVDIEAYSPAYFALLRDLPELKPLLSELQTVLIAGERVSVRVRAMGAKQLTAAELRRVVEEFRRK